MARTIGVEIIGDSASVERAFARSSVSAKNFDHSLGKSVRGAAAGAGIFRGLGRSIAFASGAFLGFAAASDVIRGSITGAEDLAKAQEGLAVAVRHTGGNLGKLIPQYTALAKGAADFGVNQSDATTYLERATVLTGSAARAQRAYQEALVISKATGKDFNAVLIATSKGQEGITTSLQRYGIQIAKGTSGTKQFSTVMGRFAGQARANTDAADRLRAVFANTEEMIGTALLPALEKYLGQLSDWLEKMQKSGRLQHDVNRVIHDGASVFHVIGDTIHAVDKVTGSFVHTLELLAAFKLASLVTGWVGSLELLAAKWGLVGSAATAAAGAEAAAVGAGAAGGAGVAARVGQYTAAGAGAAAARGAGAGILGRLGAVGAIAVGGFAAADAGAETQSDTRKVVNGWKFYSIDKGQHWVRGEYVGFATTITPQLRRGDFSFPGIAGTPGFMGRKRSGGGAGHDAGPFGNAQPAAPFKSFALTLPEQITQARANLTKSTADDVAAAKEVIARIKKLMAEGKLKGKSLLQALQAEGAAMSTLQSAQAAAAQKAAAAAQAQFQNLLDPLKLEVQLSRAEAFGKSTVPALRALLASAKKALASAENLAEEKAALDQITQLNQALKSAQTTALVTFTAPAKLQLALAKDAALGKDPKKDLLKLKAAILKFIRTHHKNTQALIDVYGQLQSVNDQLGAMTSSALGGFKQIDTAKLTRGLGLTPEQRKELRARYSQVGPGGTVSGDGTGAYGQIIGPDGRPRHRRHHPRRVPRPQAAAVGGSAGGYVIHDNQPITIYLDGKVIAKSTTRHQQRRSRRNPTQRRGPNAGG